MAIQRILVPVDGSVEAGAAFQQALEIAGLADAEVIVAYVVDIREKMSTFEKLTGEKEACTEDELEEEAGPVFAPLRKDAGEHRIRFVAAAGAPSLTITALAHKLDVQLVVMGNRGSGGMKRFMTGSVSQYVLENALCPVMIVKNPKVMQERKEREEWREQFYPSRLAERNGKKNQ